MTEDLFLRNRGTIAVITGGAQGLGLAIAKKLAKEGARGITISGGRGSAIVPLPPFSIGPSK